MPSLNGLDAWAGALDVMMHEIVLAEKPVSSAERKDGVGKPSAREKKLVRLFRSLSPTDRRDLLFIGRKMAGVAYQKERE
jgi:hypothetical protein